MGRFSYPARSSRGRRKETTKEIGRLRTSIPRASCDIIPVIANKGGFPPWSIEGTKGGDEQSYRPRKNVIQARNQQHPAKIRPTTDYQLYHNGKCKRPGWWRLFWWLHGRTRWILHRKPNYKRQGQLGLEIFAKNKRPRIRLFILPQKQWSCQGFRKRG